MKHVGILAHGVEGAALCFRVFCQEGSRKLGAHSHPDVTLDCIALGPSMAAWEQADYASIRATLARSAARLAQAGANFFICPNYAAHIALEEKGANLALPGLHIAEIVADRAALDGYKHVGVLGAKYLMDTSLSSQALSARGIRADLPEAEERSIIHEIIVRELVNGIVSDISRQRCVRVIEQLQARGCDAVALACTEMPLIVTPDISPLPVLDSTRLLARVAFEVAVGKLPMPSWRGGPIRT
jgi:aspartate racemase